MASCEGEFHRLIIGCVKEHSLLFFLNLLLFNGREENWRLKVILLAKSVRFVPMKTN